MQNKSFTDLPPDKVVFYHTYGDVIGGITISAADFNDGDIIPLGTLAGKDVNGLYHALKSAGLQADVGNAVTVYPVLKGSAFKVGDVVALIPGGKASTITAIDKTNALYDSVTVDLTLGVAATVAAGAGLFNAAATSTTTTSAPKYVPLCATARTIQIVAGDTNTVGAWHRADLYLKRAPIYAPAVRALVPGLQWVSL